MGKFKIGDKVRRVEPSYWPKQYGKVGSVYTVLAVPSETSITVIEGGSGAMANAFELVSAATPTITIEPGKHYRLRDGKVTGRVTNGDIGFEALVDGQVKVFDKAGGAVFGGEDIVEAWVPKVGERVKYKNQRFGEATVIEFVSGKHVKVDTHSQYRICTEHVSDLEPLPVAAPLRIVAGRFYKTRDGRKVGPMVYAECGPWYFVKGELGAWMADGKAEDKYTEEEFGDLIAEWVDEPVVAVANDNVEAAKPASVPKFKVGDVMRLTSERYAAKQGATAIIRKVREDGMLNLEWVRNSLHRGQSDGGYYPSNFELVISDKTPTAIVALIDDGQPKPAERPHVHASVESATVEAERLASLHRGQRFGVYVLHDTRETDLPDYGHEWKNLAARGQKIAAIKELRSLTGLNLVAAKTAVEKWAEYELAA